MRTVIAALLIGAALPASAATLDFSGVTGPTGVSLRVPGATLIAKNDGLAVGVQGITRITDNRPTSLGDGGFCFIDRINSCGGEGEIAFDAPVRDLRISYVGLNGRKDVTIAALLGGVEIGAVRLRPNEEGRGFRGVVDFSGLGALDQLVFSDETPWYANGLSYASISYNAAPVPLPAAAPLLLAGLAGLGALARRRR